MLPNYRINKPVAQSHNHTAIVATVATVAGVILYYNTLYYNTHTTTSVLMNPHFRIVIRMFCFLRGVQDTAYLWLSERFSGVVLDNSNTPIEVVFNVTYMSEKKQARSIKGVDIQC